MDEGFAPRPEEKKTKIFRVGLIVVLLTILYLMVIFNLQVFQGLSYQQKAISQAQRTKVMVAKRGEIFDQYHDMPLVMNVDSFAVFINPAEIKKDEMPKVISRLSKVLEIPEEIIEKKASADSRGIFQEIEIKSGVDFSKISQIAERIHTFPGVHWESKPKRSYLEIGSLSHVLGYVGNITQDELQLLYNQGYSESSVLGKSGIEKKFDGVLRGKDGLHYRNVDVQGRRVEGEKRSDLLPEPGKDLVLTIDKKIQTLAEKALGPRNGSVVVLKPSTGEVLAMVSYPYFDPNLFYTDDASRVFSDLAQDSNNPFLNRAIQATYPPASTFKVIMTTAILSENVYDPLSEITCRGHFEAGDRTFLDWKPEGHGVMNLALALSNSCNIYYYTVGWKYLKEDRIADYAKRFGYGAISGIDIPGEQGGLVPTPQWKKKTQNFIWLGGDTINMSIGQGFLSVTPLQVANAMALVANEGKIYKPRVLKAVYDPLTGKPIEEIKPEVLSETNIAPEVFHKVQSMMRLVVTDGTAKNVVITKAVKVAGKTGTAEDGAKGSSNHNWFASFAPYDDPDTSNRVVVVVQVEKSEANEKEYWPPKAADMIFQGIFANQTYEEVLSNMRPWYINWAEVVNQ